MDANARAEKIYEMAMDITIPEERIVGVIAAQIAEAEKEVFFKHHQDMGGECYTSVQLSFIRENAYFEGFNAARDKAVQKAYEMGARCLVCQNNAWNMCLRNCSSCSSTVLAWRYKTGVFGPWARKRNKRFFIKGRNV